MSDDIPTFPSKEEEMKHHLSAVLESKGHVIHSVAPDATVAEAIKNMNEHRVGAVLVVEGDKLVGIFTERDVLRRVVAAGLDIDATRVSEAMTADPFVVPPTLTVEEAMSVISERRHRHLPVTEGERVIGVISQGDLNLWQIRHREARIKQLVNYITDVYPA